MRRHRIARDRGLWSVSASLSASDLTALRAAIRRDANRICGWTRVDDRDGTRRYFGFNARGDTLVEVVREADDERFIFTERVYDEDGRPLADRTASSRLVRGWTQSYGGKLFTYRSYGRFDGESWRARGNLLRQVEVPVGGVVDHRAEQDAAATSNVETATGRLTDSPTNTLTTRSAEFYAGRRALGGNERIDYEVLHTYDNQCSQRLPPSGEILCDGPWLTCLVRSGAADKLLEALDELGTCWAREDDCLDPHRQVKDALDGMSRYAATSRTTGSDKASKQIGDWLDRVRAAAFEHPPRRSVERRDSSERLSRVRSEIDEAIDRLRQTLPDLRDRLDPGLVQNPCGRKRPSTLTLRRPARPETARHVDLEWNGAGLPMRLHERQGTTTRLEYYPSTFVGFPQPSLSPKLDRTLEPRPSGARHALAVR